MSEVLRSVGQRRRYLMERGDLNCIWCRRPLGSRTFTVEHVIPISKGGQHTPKNIAPACEQCNHHRADMDADEYRARFPNGAPASYRGCPPGKGPGLSNPAEQLRRRLRKAEERALRREAP